ncbi:MAG: YegS/Rv2252/BmrU family lipid kinase [Clostridia bacterium]|nr:YegS/Rv2252/BmrU family lipid kinase [Clostridia bacterium]
MSQKRLLLIANPCSGKAKMKTQLMSVVEIFSAADYEVTVYPTKCRGDGTHRASKIAQDEYDLVVACGGDGTLNEVITGIMESNVKVPIGYIPSGTLNEWSSGLGIARNIVDAAKDIVNGKETLLDIGKFGDKYFSYTASFGAFTSASYSAAQDVKNVLGQAAYFFEGIKSIGNIKPIHLKFKTEDREIEGDFLFGAISNSMSVGGIVKFDESVVKLNDGYFEVLLIKNPDNVLKLQPLIDGILRHELDRDGMEFFHAKEITVTQGEDVSWTLDGEFCQGEEEIKITNINNAVKFILPM